jgi:hypothetical protein
MDQGYLHKEYLSTSEAIRFCRYYGRTVSVNSLYSNGIRGGFMVKAPDGFHWVFKRTELNRFLVQKLAGPPPGWVSVHDLAEKHRVNLAVMYARIKAWKVDTLLCGPVNKKYVREAEYHMAKKRYEKMRGGPR